MSKNKDSGRKLPISEAHLELNDLPTNGGQSGDLQGLSQSGEDIEDLASTEQAYEASIASGVEDAGDHPGRPVRVHSSETPDVEADDPTDDEVVHAGN